MLDRARKLCAALKRRPRVALAGLAGLGVFAAAAYLAGCRLYAEHYFRETRLALERHEYRRAYECALRGLHASPSRAGSHLLAARAARLTGRPEEAEERLADCQRLGGNSQAILLEQALLRVQRGDPGPAAYLQARVDEDDPDAVLILEALIQQYVSTYRFKEALQAFDAYLARRPNDLQALLGRGWVWERVFEFARAAGDYRQAVEHHPDSDEARLRLAETLVVVGPPAEAAEQFERVRPRQPDNPGLLLGLARCRRQLGEPGEARRLLQQVLPQQPRDVGALTELGKVALDEGKAEEAERWLRQAVALAPHDRPAQYAFSQCLKRRGKTEEARDCRVRIERLDADLKRLDQLMRKVLKEPADPDLRYEVGVLFLRNGQEPEGLRWLRIALQLDPGHRPTHEALADHYSRTGNTSLADRHRQLARQATSPGNRGGGGATD
jgi:Flp pilus assembly protein TadD